MAIRGLMFGRLTIRQLAIPRSAICRLAIRRATLRIVPPLETFGADMLKGRRLSVKSFNLKHRYRAVAPSKNAIFTFVPPPLVIFSTPGQKRAAVRALSLTESSTDSEVEFSAVCGTSKGKGKRSAEKDKGKRKKGLAPGGGGGGGGGKGKSSGGRKSKAAKVPRRRVDSDSEEDGDNIKRVSYLIL